MRDSVTVVAVFIALAVMFLLVVLSFHQAHECEARGGDYVRVGQHRWVCLKKGTVLE